MNRVRRTVIGALIAAGVVVFGGEVVFAMVSGAVFVAGVLVLYVIGSVLDIVGRGIRRLIP